MNDRMRAWFLVPTLLACAGAARADAPVAETPLVVRYSAPPECPGTEAFGVAVKTELAGRRWSRAHPVEVAIVITPSERGYVARATSVGDAVPLERTVEAPSCQDAADIAAAVVALAQEDPPQPDVVVVAQPSASPEPTQPPIREAPQPSPGGDDQAKAFAYSFTLGYAAFTAGPAQPVLWASGEKTTFNPAIGARFGFEMSHALGWWKHSLHVGAAYLRQGTSTVQTPLGGGAMPITSDAALQDRDVLQATIDACPVHLDYAFVSFMPCATYSMIQSRGESGDSPGLETGLGASARLRAAFATSFFVEGTGAAVRRLTSYEPPSHDVRAFYALSLGAKLQ
jgi:hypothetical protein